MCPYCPRRTREHRHRKVESVHCASSSLADEIVHSTEIKEQGSDPCPYHHHRKGESKGSLYIESIAFFLYWPPTLIPSSSQEGGIPLVFLKTGHPNRRGRTLVVIVGRGIPFDCFPRERPLCIIIARFRQPSRHRRGKERPFPPLLLQSL